LGHAPGCEFKRLFGRPYGQQELAVGRKATVKIERISLDDLSNNCLDRAGSKYAKQPRCHWSLRGIENLLEESQELTEARQVLFHGLTKVKKNPGLLLLN